VDVLLDSQVHVGPMCEVLYDPNGTPRRPVQREAGGEAEGTSAESAARVAGVLYDPNGTPRRPVQREAGGEAEGVSVESAAGVAGSSWLRSGTGEPPTSARIGGGVGGGAGASLAEPGDSGGTGAGGHPLEQERQGGAGGSQIGRRYRVAYNFAGTDEDSCQLSLRAGDTVRVQCHDPSGWTYGHLEFACASGGSSELSQQRGVRVGDAGWFPEALLGCEELEEVETTIHKGGGHGALTLGRSGSAGVPGRSTEDPGASPAGKRCSSQQSFDRCHSNRSLAEDNQLNPASSRTSRGGRDCDALGKQDSALSLDEDSRWSGVDEARLQECEQRLASCAQSRRRYARDCESAQRCVSEAEVVAETAVRLLASLEEQERRCKAEASCAAGSNSTSLQKSAEARLRILAERREAAAQDLQSARERMEAERRNAAVARRKLRAEQQVASMTVEAVSRQRGRVKAAQQQQHQGPMQQAASPAICGSLSSPALAGSRPQSTLRQGAGSPPPSTVSSRLKQRPAPSGGSPGTASTGRTRSISPGRGPTVRGCYTPSSPAVPGPSTSAASSHSLAPASSGAALGRAPSTARSSSRPLSPNRVRQRAGPQASGRGTSSTGGQGTPLRRLGSSQQCRAKASGASRAGSPPRGRPSAAPEAVRSGAVWPLDATEEELTRASDALQSAEALQAQLAGMPEHLRASVFRQCPGLQGLLGGRA